MPKISEFFGINIFMYWFEHSPPLFHAEYGSFKALIYSHAAGEES